MIYGHGGDIYTYGDVLDFSVNVSPLGTSEHVIKAAKKGIDQVSAYPDSCCRKLAEKTARSLGVLPEYILFGNGAAEVIYTLTLAEKPGNALLPVPSFSEYERALASVGCNINYYYTKEENGFIIDQEFLDRLDDRTDMLFICSPSNPSGRTIDTEQLLRIAKICEEKKIRFVLDECFIDFLTEPEKHTLLGKLSRFRQLFIIRAFTKIHAMPGLRLGFGLSSDKELLERMKSVRQPWSVSIPAQEAGAAALDEEERIRQIRKIIRQERAHLEAGLNQMNIRYIPSEANYILFYSEKNLSEQLLKYHILIRDCSNYRGLGKGWYRIAVRMKTENDFLLEALGHIISEKKTGKIVKEEI